MAESLETAYVGLGSNLGDRAASLREALRRLADDDGVASVSASSFYETDPVGETDQPPFLNACCRVETRHRPRELLDLLLDLEGRMGRVRTTKRGPRIVDLDLLLFGDEVIDEPGVRIPHPEMHRRAFVLVPLAEIASGARHPVLGRTAGRLLADLGEVSGVRRLAGGAGGS